MFSYMGILSVHLLKVSFPEPSDLLHSKLGVLPVCCAGITLEAPLSGNLFSLGRSPLFLFPGRVLHSGGHIL